MYLYNDDSNYNRVARHDRRPWGENQLPLQLETTQQLYHAVILNTVMTSEMRSHKVEEYRCSHGFANDFRLGTVGTPMLMIINRVSSGRIMEERTKPKEINMAMQGKPPI
jgi:hypothetical protein